MYSLATGLTQWVKKAFSHRAIVLLSLLLVSSTSALTPPHDFDINIFPPQPTTEDNIRIELSGGWPDSCIPEYKNHSIDGDLIEIFGEGGPENDDEQCSTVYSSWSFDVRIGQLDAGVYNIYGAIVYRTDGSIAAESTASFEVESRLPPSVDIWADRGEGASYRVGDPLTLCYSVSRPVYIRIWKTTSEGSSIILQGNDDGTGDCLGETVEEPTGIHTYRIEAIQESQVVASDETWIQVIGPQGGETICGQVLWATSCSGGFLYPVFLPCGSSTPHLWQPSSFTPGDYYRVYDPAFEAMDPLCTTEYGNVTSRLASWSQYEQITSCEVCASPATPTPTSPTGPTRTPTRTPTRIPPPTPRTPTRTPTAAKTPTRTHTPTATPTSRPTSDLTIENVEVTQAIQTLSNAMPLVQDKPTWVRVYVKNVPGTVRGVTAELRGYSPTTGQMLPESPLPLSPRNSPISAGPGGGNRGSLNGTLNFELPLSWTQGTVSIWIEVNPDRILPESNYDNNTVSRALEFYPTGPLSVRVYPIRYQGKQPSRDLAERTSALARKVFPLAPTDLILAQPDNEVIEFDTPLTSHAAWAKLLEQVAQRCPGSQKCYGLLPDVYTSPYWGIAYVGGNTAVGRANKSQIMAHELAHTLGRKHIAGCGGGGPFDGETGQCTIGEYGFDTTLPKLYSPTIYDFMTYQGLSSQWVSPHTYERLYDVLNSTAREFQVSRDAAALLQDYLTLSGIIEADGSVDMFPAYRRPLPAGTDDQPGTGSYSLELQDALDRVLFTRHFDSTAIAEGDAEASAVYFFQRVPFSASVSRILIKHGAETLKTLERSLTPPQVQVLAPAGDQHLEGKVTIRWMAGDADGDTLSYVVEYSPDGGGTWNPIGVHLTESDLTVDTAALTGTTRGEFRVLASDGINTGIAEASGLFTIADKAPRAQIVYPEDDAAYPSGSSVYIAGTAYDREDSLLSNAQLTWSVDGSEMVGTGEQVTVSGLADGIHQITLTARDSGGNTATASINVNIGRRGYEVRLPLVERNYSAGGQPTPPVRSTATPTRTPTATVTSEPEPGSTRQIGGLEFVYVPAGPFDMGSESGDNDEQPVHTVTLDAFWISKTEITNEQYRRFIEAGGYHQQDLWTEAGWAWREEHDITQPLCWNDPRFNPPNHPVACVSWYEAIAYARWLARDTGENVQLPSEAEWEKAARGTDGRTYPWGDEPPDGTRMNYCDVNCLYRWRDETVDDGYRFTAPVGNYPAGASPYGALDVAGNVSEWTRSLYRDYPYDPTDGREDLEADGSRMLRGGAWNYNQYHRCADRGRGDPRYSCDCRGIRVISPGRGQDE